MSSQMLLVSAVLLTTIVLFVVDWLRLDVVALLALLALMLTKQLTPNEALAGFSDSLVIIIAGLFVVGAGLFRTGVAGLLGGWLSRMAGDSPQRLLFVIMAVVALLSGFMSSTGTVAILLPVVVTLANNAGISPSKLLIPLSFSSLVGGMLTLIGTPPNIVVSQQLAAVKLEPFSFFAFTPIGLVMLALTIGFMVLFGHRLLPERTSVAASRNEELSPTELAASYGVEPVSLHRLRVSAESQLLGQTVAEAQIRARYQLTVVEVIAAGAAHSHKAGEVDPATRFAVDDVLLVHGTSGSVKKLREALQIELLPDEGTAELKLLQDVGMVEVLLTPRSRLIGHTLADRKFRDRHGLTVISVLRMGKPIGADFATTRLRFGDALLVQGTWARIHRLGHQSDFVVVAEPRREVTFSRQTVISLVIMTAMLVLMTFKIVPTVVAVLAAAVAMVVFRCLSTEDAYRSISWESLVLIAGMLPMATALKKTGTMDLVVTGITASVGRFGPTAMMAVLFLLTSLFSQFISNTATTVLVAPIAYQAALNMQVSPRAYLMTVALAASTAFATPIASPVNTLVMTPGGYRFTDYAKTGVALQLLLMIAALLLVPVFFPL